MKTNLKLHFNNFMINTSNFWIRTCSNNRKMSSNKMNLLKIFIKKYNNNKNYKNSVINNQMPLKKGKIFYQYWACYYCFYFWLHAHILMQLALINLPRCKQLTHKLLVSTKLNSFNFNFSMKIICAIMTNMANVIVFLFIINKQT